MSNMHRLSLFILLSIGNLIVTNGWIPQAITKRDNPQTISVRINKQLDLCPLLLDSSLFHPTPVYQTSIDCNVTVPKLETEITSTSPKILQSYLCMGLADSIARLCAQMSKVSLEDREYYKEYLKQPVKTILNDMKNLANATQLCDNYKSFITKSDFDATAAWMHTLNVYLSDPNVCKTTCVNVKTKALESVPCLLIHSANVLLKKSIEKNSLTIDVAQPQHINREGVAKSPQQVPNTSHQQKSSGPPSNGPHSDDLLVPHDRETASIQTVVKKKVNGLTQFDRKTTNMQLKQNSTVLGSKIVPLIPHDDTHASAVAQISLKSAPAVDTQTPALLSGKTPVSVINTHQLIDETKREKSVAVAQENPKRIQATSEASGNTNFSMIVDHPKLPSQVSEPSNENEPLDGFQMENDYRDREEPQISVLKPIPPDEERETVLPHVKGKLPKEDTTEITYTPWYFGAVVCGVLLYIFYTNKKKIVAYVVEGGRPGRGSRRRPSTAKYRKLDSNLEEAVTSGFGNSSSSHVIY